MEYQHRTLIASYGETKLYSHLVEDLIKLNIQEAARFATNGYTSPSKPPQGLKKGAEKGSDRKRVGPRILTFFYPHT